MSSIAIRQLINSQKNQTKYIGELRKTIVRPLIQLAVKSIENEPIDDGVVDRISDKYNYSHEKLDEWYLMILSIFRIHLRTENVSIRMSDFKRLLQELRMGNDCVDDFSAVLYGYKRPALFYGLHEKTKFFPGLKSSRWRLDVTISTSTLSRVLEPTILMEFIVTTGQRYIFEVDLPKFDLIRHTIASLLLKMEEYETASSHRSLN